MSQRPLVLALMLAIPFSLALVPADAAAVQATGKNQAGEKAAELEQLYADYWEASLKRSPLRASSAQIAFAWFQRVIAGYCLLFGVLYWVRLVGFYRFCKIHGHAQKAFANFKNFTAIYFDDARYT